ncbi:hypothetical protein [Mesorhizobium sp. BE184]|uniref:hypothetical protein n=1 Tax=Mesorhizobium sp. BE184 TaxID=2817714 RepID=UPI00285E947A|nr:hypothetical protein [Mesorhizobium sp. BE184]MDR7032408.1 hypothetical protein [Mesorhizobium sp. BE184]
MSNLSILQRNIIEGLDCEIAAKAFLRACDRTSVLAAEDFAYEVRRLVVFHSFALPLAASGHGLEQVPDGLLPFILERHWHSRFGQQAVAA